MTGLPVDHGRLAELCSRYGVERLEIFGSYARGEASPESDLDILVTFAPNTRIGLEFVALQQELADLFMLQVDLLARAAVERSPNKYFRHYALKQTEPFYEHP